MKANLTNTKSSMHLLAPFFAKISNIISISIRKAIISESEFLYGNLLWNRLVVDTIPALKELLTVWNSVIVFVVPGFTAEMLHSCCKNNHLRFLFVYPIREEYFKVQIPNSSFTQIIDTGERKLTREERIFLTLFSGSPYKLYANLRTCRTVSLFKWTAFWYGADIIQILL